MTTLDSSPVLVLGGTGTIGRRVLAQLRDCGGADVRPTSRHTDAPFDWNDAASTRLQGADRAVRGSGLEWTIVRPDWFAQNFETFFGAVAALGDTQPTGVVESVLGRPARDFADYAGDAAARGAWR